MQLTVNPSGLSTDLDMQAPVTIGTIPLQQMRMPHPLAPPSAPPAPEAVAATAPPPAHYDERK